MDSHHDADGSAVADPQIPPHRYTAALAARIESEWQRRWAERGTFHTPNPTGSLSAGFEAVADRTPIFVMDMFPYPSGAGLHVGHPLGYIGTDVYSRFARMDGRNVLHTLGFDAFGLPAEQYAVQTGEHPQQTTEANIETYRSQLRQLGMDYDDRRSICTIDPAYYRWTQWIFLQLFGSFYDTAADRARPVGDLIAELDSGAREPALGTNPYQKPWASLDASQRRVVVDAHRLAYVSHAPVNWCPGLGTVLSNEEVTADGRSERGNFPVFRRPLRQWMLRITSYAARLLDDLETIDWPDSIKLMQRNWIGRSTGAQLRFDTDTGALEVFTTRPDTLYGATYMVLAPEHPLVDALTAGRWPEGVEPRWTGGAAMPGETVGAYRSAASRRSDLDRQTEGRSKTGVFTGSYATNPVTGAAIPVFIADYVLMGYGTGAIMAVPGQDQRDWEFAAAFGLPVTRTVQPPDGFSGDAYTGEGPAINSSAPGGPDLNGKPIAEAKAAMIEWLESAGHGRATITYKLRDWLFSRQRYWGEPFPIVYDAEGFPYPVPDDQLPVTLPALDDYSPKTFADDDMTSAPEAPLSRAADWVNVTLDLGDGPTQYRRETNTMPNWAGSCWYELRYADPDNPGALIDPDIERYWMGTEKNPPSGGVDLYVGGAEHAVLHLLYARFWHKVLYDLGHVQSSEPFHRLVNQGMIQLPAYTDSRGFYVEASEVVERDGAFYLGDEQVEREFGKIGKSQRNVVTPDALVAEYGADTFRLYEMFTGPLEASRPWDSKPVSGMHRLLQRIWRSVIDENTGALRVGDDPADPETRRLLHRSIESVRDGFSSLRFNTSIARITELCNRATQAYPAGTPVPREIVEPMIAMLVPLAPHVAEELWSRLGHAESLAYGPFPVADPAQLVDESVTVAVQVNGKVRSSVSVPAGADAATMETAARADEKVRAQLDGATVRRVIAVPGRLVNFVVG